jgi:beta-glucosidase
VRYGEGVFVGYRGYDALDRAVSYPFGHGLSYTRFAYADLHTVLTGSVDHSDLAVEVTCRITNTGSCRGKEVVQVYVCDPMASVARPPRELRAFAKVDLAAGESKTVRLRLGARDFSSWSSGKGRWVIEPGEFTVEVGASSRDRRLTTTIDVPGTPRRVPLDGTATLEEWLADPTGAALLRDAVGTDDTGRLQGILGNDELLTIVGNFPIARLTAFPGFGLDHATVDALLRQIAAQPR